MAKEKQDVIDFFESDSITFQLDSFRTQVRHFFELNPKFVKNDLPIVHSVKSRIKDSENLRKKIIRKEIEKDIQITPENLFEEVTDLVGIRVLHLYFDQFATIHQEIMARIESNEWVLFEDPKAYTWDPETKKMFETLSISTKEKESYTSVHYVVKPNDKKNSLCCEIQVRTLFEEIWGEIDHSINYPRKTNSIACNEQLRVLAKLVGTGTRLADSIFRSHKDYHEE